MKKIILFLLVFSSVLAISIFLDGHSTVSADEYQPEPKIQQPIIH